MYASIPDALRALARKIGADANGRNEEEILNNIVVKLGGTPVRNHGVAGALGAVTKVVDLDVMHNLGTLEVTPTSTAQTITPESPVDGWSQVNVAAVTPTIPTRPAGISIRVDDLTVGSTAVYVGYMTNTPNEIVCYTGSRIEGSENFPEGFNVIYKVDPSGAPV